jgi:hypothetical protein
MAGAESRNQEAEIWQNQWEKDAYSGGGTLQIVPIRVYLLLSLLSFIAVWRQAWLFLPEKTIPRSLHSWRIPVRLCVWLDHFEISPDRFQPADEGMQLSCVSVWYTLYSSLVYSICLPLFRQVKELVEPPDLLWIRLRRPQQAKRPVGGIQLALWIRVTIMHSDHVRPYLCR